MMIIESNNSNNNSNNKNDDNSALFRNLQFKLDYFGTTQNTIEVKLHE